MHNITLTGSLNGLLVIYLAKATPAGHSFRAIVPYSMRHVTKAADDEMCNHAFRMLSEYPESLVAELRNLTENSAQALELIVKLAHEFRQEMAAELARCPKNNILAGMVGVDDWYGASLSQLGKKRVFTYGISNFGWMKVVDPNEGTEDAPLKLERMIVSRYVLFGNTSYVSVPWGPNYVTWHLLTACLKGGGPSWAQSSDLAVWAFHEVRWRSHWLGKRGLS